MIFQIGVFFSVNLLIIIWYLVKDCNHTKLMCLNKYRKVEEKRIDVDNMKSLLAKIINE